MLSAPDCTCKLNVVVIEIIVIAFFESGVKLANTSTNCSLPFRTTGDMCAALKTFKK
jgi:hypothetical protein